MSSAGAWVSDQLKRVVVFGGTGAQGKSVVKALSEAGGFFISVLTRDTAQPSALELEEKHNVNLIQGSYTTEAGLRAALADQDVCYCGLDSFAVGEPEEYFWTFRAYEIAVQSGLKWFLYAGTTDRFGKFGYDERYRNSHNVVKGRITEWLITQPLVRLPWSIVHGGVYAEMLMRLLRPEGATFKAPMAEDSVIPLVPLEMYGYRVLWALRNPVSSVGRFLDCASYHVTFPEIARALRAVSDAPSSFEEISVDEWMERVRRLGINPDATLPRGSSPDPSRFLWRKSFGAWWALWHDNRGQLQDPVDVDVAWIESVYPAWPKTLEEWMRRNDYARRIGL